MLLGAARFANDTQNECFLILSADHFRQQPVAETLSVNNRPKRCVFGLHSARSGWGYNYFGQLGLSQFTTVQGDGGNERGDILPIVMG